jgi:hypothetical protein
VIEPRATGEEAIFMARHLVAAAIDQRLGFFFHAQRDVALDAVTRLAGDEGAHLGIGRHAVLHLELLRTAHSASGPSASPARRRRG